MAAKDLSVVRVCISCVIKKQRGASCQLNRKHLVLFQVRRIIYLNRDRHMGCRVSRFLHRDRILLYIHIDLPLSRNV